VVGSVCASQVPSLEVSDAALCLHSKSSQQSSSPLSILQVCVSDRHAASVVVVVGSSSWHVVRLVGIPAMNSSLQ
jgi:flagellar biosynthesis component FlhA